MLRTKINGKYVTDKQKDLSNSQPAKTIRDMIIAQHGAMSTALTSISQCKSITEVRKCLTHAREVYPR